MAKAHWLSSTQKTPFEIRELTADSYLVDLEFHLFLDDLLQVLFPFWCFTRCYHFYTERLRKQRAKCRIQRDVGRGPLAGGRRSSQVRYLILLSLLAAAHVQGWLCSETWRWLLSLLVGALRTLLWHMRGCNLTWYLHLMLIPALQRWVACRKAVPPSHASMHEAGWSHACHKLPHLQAATANGVITVQLH